MSTRELTYRLRYIAELIADAATPTAVDEIQVLIEDITQDEGAEGIRAIVGFENPDLRTSIGI